MKQKIQALFVAIATKNVERLQKNLADLKESGTNETKSTAGDKHETALAMLQIEQAKNRTQLDLAKEQLLILQQLQNIQYHATIIKGSLVKTTLGHFYISTALGKAIIDDVIFYAISAQSPMGQKLMGLSEGDYFVINNTKAIVESIT